MPLKTKSVEEQEILELARLAVEAAGRDGGMIAADDVAQRLLEDNPDCRMPLDELSAAIARVAIARGVGVKFGLTPGQN